MEEIKKINVTVTYKVGLGGIEAPLEVMKQLKKAFDYETSQKKANALQSLDEFG